MRRFRGLAAFSNKIGSIADDSEKVEAKRVEEWLDGQSNEKLKQQIDEANSKDSLLRAVVDGNVEVVAKIVREDPFQLLLKDFRDQNAYHHAVCGNNLDILDILHRSNLKNEEGIDARDKSGDTPMHRAIDEGHQEALDWLLGHGAKVTISNNRQLSPIHLAILRQNLEAVKAIVAKVPQSVNLAISDNGETPLHKAAEANHSEIINFLVVFFSYFFLNSFFIVFFRSKTEPI